MTEAPSDQQLLVDFPARSRPSVSFVSTVEVLHVRSTLDMISHKEELWYSTRDVAMMKMQRISDANALRRTLLAASSADDLEEVGLHGSQVAGLEEKVVDPAQAKNIMKTKLQHRMAVTQLQDITSEEELCRLSQISSRASCERAHKIAKTLIALV